MLKKGDRVLYSSCPKLGKYKEYTVKTDEIKNENAGCNTVFLEGYSGYVDASFCKKIIKDKEIKEILSKPTEFGEGDAIVIIAEGNTLETFLDKIKNGEMKGFYGGEDWFEEQTKDLETFKGYVREEYVYYNPETEQLKLGHGDVKVLVFDL